MKSVINNKNINDLDKKQQSASLVKASDSGDD